MSEYSPIGIVRSHLPKGTWLRTTRKSRRQRVSTQPQHNMSYVSDWSKPAKLGATIVPALKATVTTWTENDLSCLLSLFFDNLATLVGTGGVLVCTRMPRCERARCAALVF